MEIVESTCSSKQHHHAKGNQSQPSDDSLHTIVNFITTLVIEPGQPHYEAMLQMRRQYDVKVTLILEFIEHG